MRDVNDLKRVIEEIVYSVQLLLVDDSHNSLFSLTLVLFSMPQPRLRHQPGAYLCHVSSCGRVFRNRSGLTKHCNTFHLAPPSPPRSPSPRPQSDSRSNAFEDLCDALDDLSDGEAAFLHEETLDDNPQASRGTEDRTSQKNILYTDKHPIINGTSK